MDTNDEIPDFLLDLDDTSEVRKEWTVEDEKNVIFGRANEIIEKTRQVHEAVNRGLQDNQKLDNKSNVGIHYNNKIVQLSHIFNRAGIEFFRGSALNSPISYQLTKLIMEAHENINGYIEAYDVSPKKFKENATEIAAEINKHIEEYKRKGDEVYSFEIETGIIDAITNYVEKTYEWNYRDTGDTIEDFMQELVTLGFGDLIPQLEEALKQKGYEDVLPRSKEANMRGERDALVSEEIEETKPSISSEEISDEMSTETPKDSNVALEQSAEENSKTPADFTYDSDEIGEPVAANNDKDPLNIRGVYSIALQKVQLQMENTGKKAPGVSKALEFRILDYAKEGAEAFSQGDMATYEKIVLKIQGFNIKDEMAESIGVYEAYWKDVNDFHGVESTYKDELSDLGYKDMIPGIEQALNENKYGKIVEKKKNELKAYYKEFDKAILESSGYSISTQSIGKHTIDTPTDLKEEVMETEKIAMSRENEMEMEGVPEHG